MIAAGTNFLESLQKGLDDVRSNVETFDWGSDYDRKHLVMMPADGLETLKKFDAIYFGAVGDSRFGRLAGTQSDYQRYEQFAWAYAD